MYVRHPDSHFKVKKLEFPEKKIENIHFSNVSFAYTTDHEMVLCEFFSRLYNGKSLDKKLLDVAIIGGGPAGLNAALVLGRARKTVAVIDAGRPRNAVTREVHGFLTRDGISPSEFRRIAKEEISAYPAVSFVADTAVSIVGTNDRFQIETEQGQTFASKKVLFTVGMKDQLLDIPGLAEVYGKSAFVCPYCDGWE